MVQFPSINFFLGFLQFLLGFSKVTFFCAILYKERSVRTVYCGIQYYLQGVRESNSECNLFVKIKMGCGVSNKKYEDYQQIRRYYDVLLNIRRLYCHFCIPVEGFFPPKKLLVTQAIRFNVIFTRTWLNLQAPCVLYIRTGVSLISRERFLYI